MLKTIKSIHLYISGKAPPEYSPIQKLVLIPFTLLTLGDFACLGKLLGATICHFEGYSSDDYFAKTEVSRNGDGSFSAKSKFSLGPPSPLNALESTNQKRSIATYPLSELTITNVIYPSVTLAKTNFQPKVQSSITKGIDYFERQFSNPKSKVEARELINIYHETGVSLSITTCLAFLATVRLIDSDLASEWEQEILLELDLTEDIINSWKRQVICNNALDVRDRDISRFSRLDKKRKSTITNGRKAQMYPRKIW